MPMKFTRKNDVEAIMVAMTQQSKKTEAQITQLSEKTDAQFAALSAKTDAQFEALSNTTTKARYIGYCTLLLVSLVPKNLEVTRFGDIWNYLGHVMKGQVFEKTVAPLALIFAIVGILSGGQSIVIVWRVLKSVKPDSVLKFLKIPVGPK
jgi:tRNA(Met) C34 N-acetyltransferase TmcA